MSKFKVLEYNQRFMVWLGIHSHRVTEPTNEFLQSFSSYCVLFSVIMFTITSSAFFAYKHFDQFDAALEAVFIVIAGLQAGGMFLSVGFEMKAAKALQIKLQEIVDENKNEEIIELYWCTEQKCRKYTKAMTFIYLIFFEGIFVILFVYSIYFIVHGHFEPSKLVLPYYMVVPFDANTITGWYLLWLIQCFMSFNYSMCVLSTTSFFLCCCLYITAICDHFALLIVFIMDNANDIRRTKNWAKKFKIHHQTQEKLHKAIELHVKLFDIFHLVAKINNGTIFSLLPINAVFLAISMYRIEHSEFDVVSFSVNILYIGSSLSWPYIFCHFSTHTVNHIASISDIIFNTNWYDYASEWQKSIILIIARSQQGVEFSGYKIIPCNLATFGSILRTSFSFYLIFRKTSNL